MFKVCGLLFLLSVLLVYGECSQYCNSSGCFDCHHHCQTCTGPYSQNCTNCRQSLQKIDGTCQSCTKFCESCSSDEGKCQNCRSSFYLQQSTGSCKQCGEGVKQCTLSTIQSCLEGFYLEGFQCLGCGDYCVGCTQRGNCEVCGEGYFVLNGACVACLQSNCKICDAQNCYVCQPNYQTPGCLSPCQDPNCQTCTSQSCYSCNPNYYLQDNKCLPSSLLCKTSLSSNICNECQANISYLDDGRCIPYEWVEGGNQVRFIGGEHSWQEFGERGYGRVSCEGLIGRQAEKEMVVEVDVGPCYRVSLTARIGISENASAQVTIKSSQLTDSLTTTVQPTPNSIPCSSTALHFHTLTATLSPTSTITQPLSLSFQTSTNINITLFQLIIESYPCQTLNCQICKTKYKCIKCMPLFYLQNGVCVEVCSDGFYVNEGLASCEVACSVGFYGVLEDYLCQRCVQPCQWCGGEEDCLSCVEGWFLVEGQKRCYQVCPQAYHQDNQTGQCTDCLHPCKTCTSPSSCLSCQLGYYNPSTKTCTFNCPSTFYPNISTLNCQSCRTSCLQCSSYDVCISCHDGKYLGVDGRCQEECLDGFIGELGVCLECLFPCGRCVGSRSVCGGCLVGYLFEGECLEKCPSGYFQDYVAKQCQQCVSPCLSCTTNTSCLSCDPPYLFSPQSQTCPQICPQKYYPQADICQQCQPPCLACTNETYCQSCINDRFVIDEGRCLLECDDGEGMVVVNDSKICVGCGGFCERCEGEGCVRCSGGYYLADGVCHEKCPQGWYSSGDRYCSKCQSPCKSCNGPKTCLSCITPTYLLNNNCQQSCPNGYYQNQTINTCSKCSVQCQLCEDDSDVCFQCSLLYFKNGNGSCLEVCQEGFYEDYGVRACRMCGNGCAQCESSLYCTQCDDDKYLLQGSCLSSCPQRYYPSNLTCQPCIQQCQTCSFQPHNCTSCQPSLYYLPTTEGGSCLKQCPIQYFNSNSAICIKCYSPCRQCVDEVYCVSCVEGMVVYEGRCYERCGAGFYRDLVEGRCGVCEGCLECSGLAANCTKCVAGLYLSSDATSNSRQCLQTCPSGTYPNIPTKTCKPCQSPCQTCHTAKLCKTCISTYILHKYQCLANCPQKYYQNSSQCLSCVDPCEECSGQMECLSCSNGLFLEGNSCVGECGEGKYGSSGGVCLGCAHYCQQCSDYSVCTACNQSSSRPYLQGSTCQPGCSPGNYPNTTSWICQACPTNCLSCPTPLTCTKCQNSYLHNQTCQPTCPQKYYQSPIFTCQQCLHPCLNCHDTSNCKNCIDGYYLYLSFCLQSCPQGYWHGNDGQCWQDCQGGLFKDVDGRRCVEGCDYFHNYQGECVGYCLDGEVGNSSLGCMGCQGLECGSTFQYQVKYYVSRQGLPILMLLFNQPLDKSIKQINGTNIEVVGKQINVQPQEYDINAVRNLQTKDDDESINVTLKQATSTVIYLHLNFNRQFSGTITIRLKSLQLFKSNNVPLQSYQKSISIPSYHQNTLQNSDKLYYLSAVLSILTLFLIFLNLIFDNVHSLVLTIEGLQNLHFLVYLDLWYHPIVENYLVGLSFMSFRFPFIKSQELWDCDSKDIVMMGGCNFIRELILPAISIAAFIVVVILARFVGKFKKVKHHFVWNHLYGIYWILMATVGVSAFRELMREGGAVKFILAVLVAVVFSMYSAVLGYQIVKNLFSGSYEQKCFFSNLKKSKNSQPISNLHYFLLILRRLTLLIQVSSFPSKPLSALFILTLITIFILLNIFLNKSFKRYQIPIITIQIIYVAILVLLQMYVVNVGKMSVSDWNGYGVVLGVLFVGGSFGLVGIAFWESWRICWVVYRRGKDQLREGREKKKEGREKEKEEQLPQSSLSSEVSSKNSKQRPGSSYKQTQTEHQLIRSKNLQYSAPSQS